MLVLTRHVHQSIVIGHDVVVTVLEVRGDQVRLGITAPKDIQVHREEVFAALTAANRQAATSATELGLLKELAGGAPRPDAGQAGPHGAQAGTQGAQTGQGAQTAQGAQAPRPAQGSAAPTEGGPSGGRPSLPGAAPGGRPRGLEAPGPRQQAATGAMGARRPRPGPPGRAHDAPEVPGGAGAGRERG